MHQPLESSHTLSSDPEGSPSSREFSSITSCYLKSLCGDGQVPVHHIDPLKTVAMYVLAVRAENDTADPRYVDVTHMDIPIEGQIAHIAIIQSLLGEQASAGVAEVDLTDDPQNLQWMASLYGRDAVPTWPIAVGTGNEEHDRTDHIDVFVFSPPAQTAAISAGFEAAYEDRIETVRKGKFYDEVTERYDYEDGLVIPGRFGSSSRGPVRDGNLLAHFDNSTGEDFEHGSLSPQTGILLRPLLEEGSFGNIIQAHIEQRIENIESYITGGVDEIERPLAPTLSCLEATKLYAQDKDLTPEEIRVGLYEVVKDYIRTAAKLRGEDVPVDALDFWPVGEDGEEVKTTMKELIEELKERKTDLLVATATEPVQSPTTDIDVTGVATESPTDDVKAPSRRRARAAVIGRLLRR